MLQDVPVGLKVKGLEDTGMSLHLYHFILVVCLHKMLDNWVSKSALKTEFNMAGKCILYSPIEMK